jgi:hypothetical protein
MLMTTWEAPGGASPHLGTRSTASMYAALVPGRGQGVSQVNVNGTAIGGETHLCRG